MRASYTDGQGTLESVESPVTAAVANVNDAPTGGVTVEGAATQKQTLTASNTLADADGMGVVHYQWLRDGEEIAHATASTYTLDQADVGRAISVRASYVDGQGTPEAVTSAATARVADVNDAPEGRPGITGTAAVGQHVAVSLSSLRDLDGLPGPEGYSYQWQRDGQDIPGATAASYRVVSADAGAQLGVRVSYVDGGGFAQQVQASAVAVPAGGTVEGGPSADELRGGTGDDRIDGRAGLDTVIYAGERADYRIERQADGSHVVSGPVSGQDTLTDIERLRFDDGEVALDLGADAAAGTALRLITVLLGPQASRDAALVGEVIAYLDTAGVQGTLQLLWEQGVIADLAGGAGSAALLNLLFTNVVGHAPSPAELQQLQAFQTDGGYSGIELVRIAAGLEQTALRADLPALMLGGLPYQAYSGPLYGTSQADVFRDRAGIADRIEGLQGIDTVTYAGAASKFTVQRLNDGSLAVTNEAGVTDLLSGMERVRFADGALAFDVPDGPAGQALSLMTALAGKASLDNQALVGDVLKSIDEHGLDSTIRLLVDQGVTARLAGSNSDEALVQLLYTHVTGQAAQALEVQAALGLMSLQGWDQAELIGYAAQLPATAAAADLIGYAQTGIAYLDWA
ncbi:hypothetical protein [Xenophilus sp. Marseille-Q4582]|uniref:hypothetical protein n=1 Tax=Xenophilus sp. Marseille-Q4582 TaxID=2866600 RepID=UPI001CE3F819|nr:hypothetical protein [Xenophilus sp. Marseille-Q4582]